MQERRRRATSASSTGRRAPGDVRDSLADISAAHAAFGFTPAVPIEGRGLEEYMAWVANDPLTPAARLRGCSRQDESPRARRRGHAGPQGVPGAGRRRIEVYGDLPARRRGAWTSFPMYERRPAGAPAGRASTPATCTASCAPWPRSQPRGRRQLHRHHQAARGGERPRALALTINALFPHRLADLCAAAGARLIHISTDCVFSGRKGGYTEDDLSDAEDLYGRSKASARSTAQAASPSAPRSSGATSSSRPRCWSGSWRSAGARSGATATPSSPASRRRRWRGVMGEVIGAAPGPARPLPGRQRADHQVRPAHAAPRRAGVST